MHNYFFRVLFMVALLLVSFHPEVLADSEEKQQQAFFETLNDLPLMPGLYEILDESVVFDKPEGRFIESSAATDQLAIEEIKTYYNQTLPQMGWERITPEAFVRQDEKLMMDLDSREGYTVVRFTVAPRK